MKLQLLGSGANECVPALRCRCTHCETARNEGGKNVRQNSCVLVENEGTVCLIDFPPQLTSLLNIHVVDDRKIGNFFISHRHEDHILGLRSLLQSRSEKGFVQTTQAKLFMGQAAYHTISAKYLYGKKDRKIPMETEAYKFEFFFAMQKKIINSLTFTPLETGHLHKKNSTDESFGYLIENMHGIKCAYLVDAPRQLPSDTLDYLSKIKLDLLISDCTFAEAGLDSGHNDIEGNIDLKKHLNPDRMVCSHIGHNNYPYKKLCSILRKEGIETGYDGMKITL